MERNKYHVSHPRADLHTDARVSPERPLRRPHSRFGCRRRHALVIHPPPPHRPRAPLSARPATRTNPFVPLTSPHTSPSLASSASRPRSRLIRPTPVVVRVGITRPWTHLSRPRKRARRGSRGNIFRRARGRSRARHRARAHRHRGRRPHRVVVCGALPSCPSVDVVARIARARGSSTSQDS